MISNNTDTTATIVNYYFVIISTHYEVFLSKNITYDLEEV